MKNIVFAMLVLSLMVYSCKEYSDKKELRTKIYPLRAYNNSGLTGHVTFMETSYSDTVIVKLEAQNLMPDSLYLTHLHTGTPGNLTGTVIYFHHIQTSTGNIMREETWNENFGNALVSNTCFTVHHPSFFSNDTIGYVLAGNTGGNAQ